MCGWAAGRTYLAEPEGPGGGAGALVDLLEAQRGGGRVVLGAVVVALARRGQVDVEADVGPHEVGISGGPFGRLVGPGGLRRLERQRCALLVLGLDGRVLVAQQQRKVLRSGEKWCQRKCRGSRQSVISAGCQRADSLYAPPPPPPPPPRTRARAPHAARSISSISAGAGAPHRGGAGARARPCSSAGVRPLFLDPRVSAGRGRPAGARARPPQAPRAAPARRRAPFAPPYPLPMRGRAPKGGGAAWAGEGGAAAQPKRRAERWADCYVRRIAVPRWRGAACAHSPGS